MKAIILGHERGSPVVLDREGSFRLIRGHASEPTEAEVEISEQTVISCRKIALIAAGFIIVLALGIFAWMWTSTDHYIADIVIFDDDGPVPLEDGGNNAGASAEIGGTGNEQKVTITVTDILGTYTQTFDYLNGAQTGTYIIKGSDGNYTVKIKFQGNCVETTEITKYESRG